MYVCMYVCMYACMYVCMYVCVYIYIYIYIYIYMCIEIDICGFDYNFTDYNFRTTLEVLKIISPEGWISMSL